MRPNNIWMSRTKAPWHDVPPPLTVYRERGHRRLSVKTYGSKCETCMWGCRMAVEMIIDHWNPDQRRYRTETFCYGCLARYTAPGQSAKSLVVAVWSMKRKTGWPKTPEATAIRMSSPSTIDVHKLLHDRSCLS